MRKILGRLLPIAVALTASGVSTAIATAVNTGPEDGVLKRLAQYGQAVAVVDGDVLIAEPQRAGKPGVVYVYRKTGNSWAEAATLTGSEKAGDGFGMSMSLDGRTLLVGAATQNARDAAAYIFERDPSGAWRPVARLASRDTAGPSLFGYSVALKGDVALIGAPLEDETKGAIYMFRRGASGWQRVARFGVANATPQTFIGVGLEFAEDRALIASPSRGIYGFHRVNDEWKETGLLPLAGVQGGFGLELRIAGNEALIGAPSANDDAGAVFRFTAGDAGAWTPAGRITADAAEPTEFGAGLALDGERLWIGASRANQGRGAAHVYTRSPTGEWTRSLTVEHRDGQKNDGFGANLAYANGVLVSGMVSADYGAGKAAIYQGEPARLTLAATLFKDEENPLEKVTGREIKCADNNGKAAEFSCGDVDLLAFLPISAIGGTRGVHLNDVWGWTDPQTSKEYALVGRINGTSFVDISDPVNPVYVGDLPMTEGAQANAWRDIKVHKDHAYVVADGAGEHGIQVFDLTKLREFKGQTIEFKEDAHYDRIHSAHNIVINEESGFAYAVGSSMGGETCGGGLHMVDIRDPKKPTFAGCFADAQTGNAKTGYSHDAQCVTYKGPDTQYQGKEICIGSNETHISIADVTDKKAPKAISRASYPNVSYTHQGWFTDDHRYFLVDDEGDEVSGVVQKTRTLVWDLEDLDDPILVKEFLGTTGASDHNLYVKGNLVFQANYSSGLRILDITDPTNPTEVGWFDTVPTGENSAGFTGAWSNYPYFKSGVIAVSSIEQGLFLVRKAPTRRVISQ